MPDERKSLETAKAGLCVLFRYLQHLSKQIGIEPTQHRSRINSFMDAVAVCLRAAHHQKLGGYDGLATAIALSLFQPMKKTADGIHQRDPPFQRPPRTH